MHKFVHKPAQVELQLDRPQLPYSETFEPITAGGSPAQHTIHKKGPYSYIINMVSVVYLDESIVAPITIYYINEC